MKVKAMTGTVLTVNAPQGIGELSESDYGTENSHQQSLSQWTTVATSYSPAYFDAISSCLAKPFVRVLKKSDKIQRIKLYCVSEIVP